VEGKKNIELLGEKESGKKGHITFLTELLLGGNACKTSIPGVKLQLLCCERRDICKLGENNWQKVGEGMDCIIATSHCKNE